MNKISGIIQVVCCAIFLSISSVGQGQSIDILQGDTLTICPNQPFALNAVATGLLGTGVYSLDTIPFSPEPVGGTNLNMGDDVTQGNFPIGFCFEYFDSTYTDFWICSNGWISFEAPVGGWAGNWTPNNPADLIPSMVGNVPKNAIFAPWKDWNPGAGGTISYQTVGTAPFRKLIVTWSGVAMFSCTTTQGTFQIVLNETSNTIEQHLTDAPSCPQWGNGEGTQGLHSTGGAAAYWAGNRNATQWDTTNASYRWTPSGPAGNKINWTMGVNKLAVGQGPNLTQQFGVNTSRWFYAEAETCTPGIIDSVYIELSGNPATLIPFDAQCAGDSTGSLLAMETLGLAGPLDYYFFDNNNDTVFEVVNSTLTTQNALDLPAGNYSVFILASDGNCASADTVINEPPALVAGVGMITPTSCNGPYCDGGATGNAQGGSPGYSYVWSGGSVGASTVSLCSGTNTVTVTDFGGCSDTISFQVLEPAPIDIVASGTDTICLSNFKQLSVAPSGGSPPYAFTWTESINNSVINNGFQFQVQPSTTTTYTVSVTDANNCPGPTSPVTVTVRDPLMVEVSTLDTICPGDSIDLFVVSVSGGDGAFNYSWSGGLGVTDIITVGPVLTTEYGLTVTDGCGSPAVVDSTKVQVGGYPRIFVDVAAEEDSLCLGDHTVLRAKAFGGFGGEPERTYVWDDGTVGPTRLVSPDATTSYSVTVNDQCLSPQGIGESVIYIGNYPSPTFTSLNREGCAPVITAIELPEVIQNYDYRWDFGDGSGTFQSKQEALPYQFTQPGCYDISLTVTTEIGCVTSITRDCFIKVNPNPRADFMFDPMDPTNLQPNVTFTDLSTGATVSEWLINDPTFSGEANVEFFEHQFSQSGDYFVTLIVGNEFNCFDTLSDQLVTVGAAQTFYLPKAFSPNNDGLNDLFGPIGEHIPVEDYKMLIFDRWGGVIFESNNPDDKWNGRYDNGAGNLVPVDTYPYIIRYKGLDNVTREVIGRVTYAPTE